MQTILLFLVSENSYIRSCTEHVRNEYMYLVVVTCMVESHLDIVNEFPYLSSNGVDTIKVRNFVTVCCTILSECIKNCGRELFN